MKAVHKTKKRPLLVFKIFLAAALLLPFLAVSVRADNVVQGFTSSETIRPGQIVSLDSATNRTVKATTTDNVKNIYGVVVDPSDAPITLAGQDTKVFVATTGTYQVLVSVSNGVIKTGDYISISPISGIGAKAAASEPTVLGRAASSFNGSSNVVTTSNGKNIGRIFVNIAVAKNPIVNSDPTLPAFLRKAADGLANKSVPVIRVYIALLIFLISLLAAVTVLYSGVRSSLISIGRNPLSKKVIFSGMYKTVFTGIGVFIIGIAGVYL
ncbi:hypothetical protein KW792_00765, partial [Candidatus Saccharibacteria bacterium]|nr:hypothetical protein [Candidatus Saccharibacteria bacterium]